MGEEIITFGNIEIEKRKFHHHKNLILLEYRDIYNIQVSSIVSSGEKNYKYFTGYIDDDDYIIKPLHIMLPKTSAYGKSYDGETKWMYYFIDDGDLLKKYNDIWNKVSNSMKKELDCEHIYNEIFLKTKIKSYGDHAKDFHDKEIPKVGSNYTCLEVQSIDFVLKKDEDYHHYHLLKKNVNALKKRKWWLGILMMT